MWKYVKLSFRNDWRLTMFDFDNFPIKLSGKTVAVLEFEQEDEWNGLPISTPPYIICGKCKYDKCVPLDYHSKRGYHHVYKED